MIVVAAVHHVLLCSVGELRYVLAKLLDLFLQLGKSQPLLLQVFLQCDALLDLRFESLCISLRLESECLYPGDGQPPDIILFGGEQRPLLFDDSLVILDAMMPNLQILSLYLF